MCRSLVGGRTLTLRVNLSGGDGQNQVPALAFQPSLLHNLKTARIIWIRP